MLPQDLEQIERSDTVPRRSVRDRVLADIRQALLTGRIVPGEPVTLRGLAASLGVSSTPVREAVHQLVADNALEIRPNGGIHIPQMNHGRLAEIAHARKLLEADAACLALPNVSDKMLKKLRKIDNDLDRTIETGDVDGYMRHNYLFHFTLYRAPGTSVLVSMIESLWLQFGPFMRMVCGRVGTANLVDHHQRALAAIERRDPKALADAVRGDIEDGYLLLREELAGN